MLNKGAGLLALLSVALWPGCVPACGRVLETPQQKEHLPCPGSAAGGSGSQGQNLLSSAASPQGNPAPGLGQWGTMKPRGATQSDCAHAFPCCIPCHHETSLQAPGVVRGKGDKAETKLSGTLLL